MLRVRPGVLLVLASFVPIKELIRLDLPTFERPRKAISGTPAGGKCFKSLAESIKRASTRIETVSSVKAADGKRRRENSYLKSKRAFGMYVLLLERMEFVPEVESAGDDETDEDADQEKPAVGGEHDQQNGDDRDGNDETGGSPQAQAKAPAGPGFHDHILIPHGDETLQPTSALSNRRLWFGGSR